MGRFRQCLGRFGPCLGHVWAMFGQLFANLSRFCNVTQILAIFGELLFLGAIFRPEGVKLTNSRVNNAER